MTTTAVPTPVPTAAPPGLPRVGARTYLSRGRRRRRRAARALLLGAAAVVAWQVVAWQLGAGGPGALGWAGLPAPWEEPAPAPSPTALDPDLAARFARAQAAAAAEGVPLTLTSGWRSPEEQQRLVDEAVAEHGSLEAAQRWVLPPETSAHVAGLAIDVGPLEGALWLAERSGEYGLCRTYDNEWWHFEPMPADGVCPAPLPDSSWGW